MEKMKIHSLFSPISSESDLEFFFFFLTLNSDPSTPSGWPWIECCIRICLNGCHGWVTLILVWEDRNYKCEELHMTVNGFLALSWDSVDRFRMDG